MQTRLIRLIDDLTAAVFKAQKRDKYARAAGGLSRGLQNNWTAKYVDALDAALGILRRSPGKPTAADIDRVLASLSEDLGVPLAEAIRSDLKKVTTKIYEAGARDIVGAGYAFDLIDERAIRVLSKHSVFWVGDFYDKQLGKTVAKLGAQIIKDGVSTAEAGAQFKALFTGKVPKGLKPLFGKTFPKRTASYWKGLANNTVTRGREMGHVGGYVEGGIKEIEIVAIIDDLTSPICLDMNGRRFEIERVVQLRDDLIASEDPEKVKQVAPWRSVDDIAGLSDADLPAGMEFPPYHFNCRTRSAVVVD